MDRFINWLKGLPKIVQILFILLFLGSIGFLLYYFTFKYGVVEEEEPVEKELVLLEVPGASLNDKETSRVETYKREDLKNRVSASDYWDQLESERSSGTNTGSGSTTPSSSSQEEELDPNVYSPLEIYYIRGGIRTKAEIDAEHARAALEEKSKKPTASQVNLPKDDSLYFAKLEEAYRKSQQPSAVQGQETDDSVSVDTTQKERRTIDFGSTDSYSGAIGSSDAIITSWDQESRGIVYSEDGVVVTPVKATFLKTERIISGQRIIMRLIDDLRLSDGTRIPANTHVSGICSVGSRLDIKVTTLNYGGRIFRTDMSVYDSDGTEGIYCPVIEKKKAKKAAGAVANQATTGIASTATSLFTRNPYLGNVASSGINELSKITLNDGSVAINIVAGYEFYILENIKDAKDAKKEK